MSKVSSSGKSNGSSSKGKEKEAPAGLTREERARRKQAALFRDDEPSSGSFALAKAQQRASSASRPSPGASDSPRASPALSKASTSSRTGSPAAGASSSTTTKSKPASRPSSLSRSSGPSSSAAAAPAAASTGGASSARSRLANLARAAPQKLNTVKRDTRTIEEIERDMRAKKGSGGGGSSGGGLAATGSSAGGSKAGRAGAGADGAGSAAAPKPRNGAAASSTTSYKPSRQRSASVSSSSSSYDSDSADDRRRRAKKKRRTGGRNASDLNEVQRATIWEIMGRKKEDRERALARDYDSDEGSSDMEATGSAVLEEERRACVFSLCCALTRGPGLTCLIDSLRSARLAAKEDAEEQERLRQYAERKKARKAGLA